MEYPEGKPGLDKNNRELLTLHNRVTTNTFDLLRTCYGHGIPHSLEQPFQSVMLYTKAYKAWEALGPDSVTLDYCMYGMNYRKRTKLMSWQPDGENLLGTLKRMCNKSHTHVVLSGWKHGDLANQPTKHGSAAYPHKLCLAWARTVNNKLG
jgi:hypothetical protein